MESDQLAVCNLRRDASVLIKLCKRTLRCVNTCAQLKRFKVRNLDQLKRFKIRNLDQLKRFGRVHKV